MDKIKIAQKMYNKGVSLRKISTYLDVDKSTVSYWKKNNFAYKKDFKKIDIIKNNYDYSYILGLYLGDGYINKMKRTYRLRLFLDSKYENINNEIIMRLQNLFSSNKVNSYTSKGTTIIYVYSNQLAILFPQHGKGKKHNRNIILSDWQKELIIPEQLIRGLFQSDGSFYKTGKYLRYNFTNYSNDIKNIYKEYCDILNVHYTNSNFKTISHYTQKDVNKLYKILGEKN